MPTKNDKQYKSVQRVREATEKHPYAVLIISKDGLGRNSVRMKDSDGNHVLHKVSGIGDDLAIQCVQAHFSTQRKIIGRFWR